MPEGHTIHRLARDLAGDFSGRRVSASSPQGRFEDAVRLQGRTLSRTHAIGKHLFLEFKDLRVHVHLGLFGKFRRVRAGAEPRPTVRLRLSTEDITWDLTGPTACELMDDDAFDALRDRLGADPLANEVRPKSTWTRLHASRRSIGALLLDQSLFAGIGNVYRAELLFLVGLHPNTPGQDVPRPTFERLWRLAKDLLQRGVEANRIITVPLAERRAAARSRRERFYVYRRTTCGRCGASVARTTSAARTLYYCPVCQPPLFAEHAQ